MPFFGLGVVYVLGTVAMVNATVSDVDESSMPASND